MAVSTTVRPSFNSDPEARKMSPFNGLRAAVNSESNWTSCRQSDLQGLSSGGFDVQDQVFEGDQGCDKDQVFKGLDETGLIILVLMIKNMKPTAAFPCDPQHTTVFREWVLKRGWGYLGSEQLDDYVFLSCDPSEVASLTQKLGEEKIGEGIFGEVILGDQLWQDDHRVIGRFLGVPECCLQSKMIPRGDAVAQVKSWGQAATKALHFCPHLPCSPSCEESRKLGRQLLTALTSISARVPEEPLAKLLVQLLVQLGGNPLPLY